MESNFEKIVLLRYLTLSIKSYYCKWHFFSLIFPLAVLAASFLLFYRSKSLQENRLEDQAHKDFSEAYSVLHSYYKDLRMPPIKDIVMKPMDDSASCPSDYYRKEVLFSYPKIESGCLCDKQFYPADPCLKRKDCFPITSQMKASFTNFRKSKFCINRYKEDEYKWAIPGFWFCEPSNLFFKWGLTLCLKTSFPTTENHIFAGVVQGTEGLDFDQNPSLHKVKFLMVNQANAGLFDVIGLIVGVGKIKPCSSSNRGGFTPNSYPPSKLFFSDCGKYGSKEYVEPLDVQLDNERMQPLKEFFASNYWLDLESDFISSADSPPNFQKFFTNTEQITLYQIRRPPEGANSICRIVKEEDLKIKINVNAMEDVDYIYNLSLTNIILCCAAIILIPFSFFLLTLKDNTCLYICFKIICFSIAIICFLQAGLYWNSNGTNQNIENSGDKGSTLIKELINKECFRDPIDPINNLKLKNVLKAAQDLANAQDLVNNQTKEQINSNFYPVILFLFIFSIICFIVLSIESVLSYDTHQFYLKERRDLRGY